MAEPFNIKRLILSSNMVKPAQKAEALPRHKPGEKFLKGPIPWAWISRAAQLPGKALHVAIVLWFLAGMKRNRTIVLSGTVLRALGVSRHSGYRGLRALEAASLVSVERHAGRSPVVTILNINTEHGRN